MLEVSDMRRTKISIRIDNDLLAIIDMYAELTGLGRSEVIRIFCKAGSQNKANMKLQREFIEDQRKRWINLDRTKIIEKRKNIIFERDGYKCRKCGRTSDLIVYSIDKNPLNKDPAFKITLCKGCKELAEKYSPQRRVFEDFVEWLCLL